MYEIIYHASAKKHIIKLLRDEPKSYEKLTKLLIELSEHPTTGTGHPHQLKGDKSGQWARSITKKHRLVYEIRETEVIVIIISAYGHYDDK